MEQQLYLSLEFFAFSLTILSFIIQKNIPLRFFSGLFLVAIAAIGIGENYVYIGWNANNVDPYSSSAAGDPERQGELYSCWGYGLFGAFQIIYAVFLMFKWADERLKEAVMLKKSKATFAGENDYV